MQEKKGDEGDEESWPGMNETEKGEEKDTTDIDSIEDSFVRVVTDEHDSTKVEVVET